MDPLYCWFGPFLLMWQMLIVQTCSCGIQVGIILFWQIKKHYRKIIKYHEIKKKIVFIKTKILLLPPSSSPFHSFLHQFILQATTQICRGSVQKQPLSFLITLLNSTFTNTLPNLTPLSFFIWICVLVICHPRRNRFRCQISFSNEAIMVDVVCLCCSCYFDFMVFLFLLAVDSMKLLWFFFKSKINYFCFSFFSEFKINSIKINEESVWFNWFTEVYTWSHLHVGTCFEKTWIQLLIPRGFLLLLLQSKRLIVVVQREILVVSVASLSVEFTATEFLGLT